MTNYYLKDIKTLKIILLIVFLSSIIFISISYSHYLKELDNEDYNINIVYNEGIDNLVIDTENYNKLYKFTINGYNNTNIDKEYNILINKNKILENRIKDKYIYLTLLDDNYNVLLEDMNLDGLDNNLIIKTLKINKKSNFNKQFFIKLNYINNDNLLGDKINNNKEYYDLKISVN